jgi:hypothetical protein
VKRYRRDDVLKASVVLGACAAVATLAYRRGYNRGLVDEYTRWLMSDPATVQRPYRMEMDRDDMRVRVDFGESAGSHAEG